MQADTDLQTHAERVALSQQALQGQQEELPAIEDSWRAAQLASTEYRSRIMQVQQRIELESAHQRNASNILVGLAQRRERLMQEKNMLAPPDSAQL